MGDHFVDLMGEHLAQIEPADFEMLAVAVAHLRFGTLRRQYAVDFTDAQTTTTWVVRSRSRKTVQDYGGAGPDRLRQVEDLIDDAAAPLRWRPTGGVLPEGDGRLFVGLPVDDRWRPPLERGEQRHWTQAREHVEESWKAAPRRNAGDAQAERLPLFIYGSLLAGSTREVVFGSDIVSREPARARGRIVPDGNLVRAVFDEAGPGTISGEVVWLRHDTFDNALHRLEQFEGGLFRRCEVLVALESGKPVRAFAYV